MEGIAAVLREPTPSTRREGGRRGVIPASSQEREGLRRPLSELTMGSLHWTRGAEGSDVGLVPHSHLRKPKWLAWESRLHGAGLGSVCTSRACWDETHLSISCGPIFPLKKNQRGIILGPAQ